MSRALEGTLHATTSGLGGASPSAMSGTFIVIGDHSWTEFTPPGGGWHEETIGSQGYSPFPLDELLPYLVDVHPLQGRIVRGHATVGVTATLDRRGVRVMEQYSTTTPVTRANQIIQSIVFRIRVGAASHRPRLLTIVEQCVQDGHPYVVDEQVRYYDWDSPVQVAPPAA